MMKLGTVDFYPGQSPDYGHNQPGCNGYYSNLGSCSHSRSHELYAASIKNDNCKATGTCLADPQNIPSNCKDSPKPILKMGYWTDPSVVGTYIVDTTGSEPYCV